MIAKTSGLRGDIATRSLAVLVLALSLGHAAVLQASGLCPSSGTCSSDSDCVQIATSLRPTDSDDKSDTGWNADGGSCGINKDSGVGCGVKLGASVCGDDMGGGSCDPFNDPRCCAPDDIECLFEQQNQALSRQPKTVRNAAASPEQTAERFRQAALVVLPREAESLLQGLAAARAVHLKARIQLSRPSLGISDLTTYETWEAGSRYRIKTDVDPRLGLQDIPEMAFDGRHHQMLLRSHRRTLLSLTAQDTRRGYFGFPDPLFLPLFFFTPEDQDVCALCDLRLSDLRRIAVRSETTRGAVRTAAPSLPAGRILGRPTSFRTTLDGDGYISEIRRVTPEGVTVAVVRLSRYQPVGTKAFSFPRHLEWVRNDAAGKPVTTLAVAIDEIEVDPAVNDSLFTLPFTLAEKVLDSDADRWLKVSPNAPTCIE